MNTWKPLIGILVIALLVGGVYLRISTDRPIEQVKVYEIPETKSPSAQGQIHNTTPVNQPTSTTDSREAVASLSSSTEEDLTLDEIDKELAQVYDEYEELEPEELEVDESDDESAVANAVPESYLNPPEPPPGGIDAVWERATKDNVAERTIAYANTYYPLVHHNADISQYDERTRAEYERQKAALEEELFDSIRASIQSTPAEILADLPQQLLNTLRKGGFIE